MKPGTRITIEVGQVWEGRARRRDGTRERTRIVALTGRQAVIISENPLRPQLARRTVGIMISLNGKANVGNLRLAELADGGKVSWPPAAGMLVTYEARST